MTDRKPVLSDKTNQSNQTNKASFIAQIVKQLQLTWYLFQDNRVSMGTKAILPLMLLYVISPLDILPDVLVGLGQLDDFGVVLLGMTLFVKFCPPDIVEYYRKQIDVGGGDDKIIEVPYQEVSSQKVDEE